MTDIVTYAELLRKRDFETSSFHARLATKFKLVDSQLSLLIPDLHEDATQRGCKCITGGIASPFPAQLVLFLSAESDASCCSFC